VAVTAPKGTTMAAIDFDQRVEAVRRFNRFYTRQIGVLSEGYLQSPFSLTGLPGMRGGTPERGRVLARAVVDGAAATG
jgi:hypothetical protein